MMKNNLRKRAKISYYEPEEHDLDEYIFCTECGDYVVEYCAVHGPLLVIPDTKVSVDSTTSLLIPRAALTIPEVFLHIAPSIIPGAGLGVFTSLALPPDVRFGPYTGEVKKKIGSPYCWQIYTANRALLHVVDAASPDSSNWMRYVNCSRHWNEQNLVAYQYRGEIYYRTLKIIPRNTELLVYYGTEYAKELGIDIRGYNDPKKYVNYITKSVAKGKTAACTSQDVDAAYTSHDVEEAFNEKDQTTHEEFIKISFENNTVKFEEVDNNHKLSSETKNDCNDYTNIINDAELYQIRDDSTKEIDYTFNSDTNFYENEFNNADKDTEKQYENTAEDNEIDTSIRDIGYDSTIYNLADTGYFQCQICNHQSLLESGIKQHIKLHDPNRRFECYICHYKYLDNSKLKRHINSVHLNRNKYQCTICNATFSKPIYLQNHRANVHYKFGENQRYNIDAVLNKDVCNLNTNNIQQNMLLNDSKTYEENMHTNKENESINTNNAQRALNIDKIIYTAPEPNNVDIYSQRTDCGIYQKIEKTELGQPKPSIDQNNEINNYDQDYYKIDNLYKCNNCGYKTISQYHIGRHTLLHDERRAFPCYICKLRYSDRKCLVRHLNCVHQPGNEICVKKHETERCRDEINDNTTKDTIGFLNTNTDNKYAMSDMKSDEIRENDNAITTLYNKDKVAEMLNNTETPRKIDNIEETINSDLKYRVLIDMTFQCLNCDFKTASEYAIKRHVDLHDSQRKEICHICNCRFKTRKCLKGHVRRVHYGEKRFKCNLCDAKFGAAQSLKNHIVNIHMC